MNRKLTSGTNGKVTAFVLAGVAVLFFSVVGFMRSGGIVDATIKRLERIHSDSGGYYLVYTDKGTLSIQDSLLIGRWSSSDLYGKLEVDSKYRFDTLGWRIPIFSAYPNIKTATKIEN